MARPELAVLLSYAKIALLHDLLASQVPDEPSWRNCSPTISRRRCAAVSRPISPAHRLRREIIATTLTNGIVNRCGPPTALRLAEEAARPISEVAHAFMAARAVFGLADLWRRLDALDGKVAGSAQLDLYLSVQYVLNRNVAWFLRHAIAGTNLSDMISRIRRASSC